MAQCYVGVKLASHGLREKILSFVDPAPQGDIALVGKSYEDVVDQIMTVVELSNSPRAAVAKSQGLAGGGYVEIDPNILLQLSDTAGRLQEQARHAEHLNQLAAARMAAVYSSTSWRITAPLRSLTRAVRGEGAKE
jgi:hypothetical protein